MVLSRNWLFIGLLSGCLALSISSFETQSLNPTLRNVGLLALTPSQPIAHGNPEIGQGNWPQSLLQKEKSKKDEEELESFEDDILVLTRVSEQLMMNQLSLRSFRCQERIVVTEQIAKSGASTKKEFVNQYEVKRKAENRANPQLTFVETRKPQTSNNETNSWSDADFPVLENPFSGFIIQSFSFENRLANDFKKKSNETMAGRDCLKFGFETVPQLSGSSISIMGNHVSLRQRGFVWLDGETNRLVRLSAQLTKLPKGFKTYEYDVSFSHGKLFDKEIQLPTHIDLKVQLKDKNYHVEQHYNQFEPL